MDLTIIAVTLWCALGFETGTNESIDCREELVKCLAEWKVTDDDKRRECYLKQIKSSIEM